jgi:DNA-directed RNA polymerase subunit RPC12/RpoP
MDMKRGTKTYACLDCGSSIEANDGVARTRCDACRQRYEVQLFLLRQFLSKTR